MLLKYYNAILSTPLMDKSGYHIILQLSINFPCHCNCYLIEIKFSYAFYLEYSNV